MTPARSSSRPRPRASSAALASTALTVLAAVALAGTVGCRGTGKKSSRSRAQDASVAREAPSPAVPSEPPPPPPSSTYPAVPSRIPKLEYRGGRVLKHPQLVTVTFADEDPVKVARMEEFGRRVFSTSWWKSVTTDLCVAPGDCIGEGRFVGAVRIKANAPRGLDEIGEAAFVHAAIEHHELPPPTADTLYLLHFPKTAQPGGGETYCGKEGIRGRHGIFKPPGPTPGLKPEEDYGIFATVYDCEGDLDEQTATTSHEIVEAASDPIVGTGILPQAEGSARVFTTFGPEVVDACALLTIDRHRFTADGFVFDRVFSSRGAAGLEPCVPDRESQDVYRTVAPEKLLIGIWPDSPPETIMMTAVSSGPTPNWTLSAFELDEVRGARPNVEVQLDRAIVNNGTRVTLTIKRLRLETERVATVAVVSTFGMKTTMFPIRIGLPRPIEPIREEPAKDAQP